jgi:hypothetical protein
MVDIAQGTGYAFGWMSINKKQTLHHDRQERIAANHGKTCMEFLRKKKSKTQSFSLEQKC